LLAGFELQQDRDLDAPFAESVKPASFVVDQCFKRKLILRAADFEKGKDIVAIAPPLIINKQEISEMINIIDTAVTEFNKTIK
jgi:putrescine---pyruvate transaminase